MGLGTIKNDGATYLSIAGGYIWDRKADKADANYKEQEYEKQDKTTGIRSGAAYADLTGRIVKVEFRTHAEYGESVNVTFLASEKEYIVSISTNNRYSQDMMKCLLVMDLEKDLFMKPYDFVGQDKKRAQGISFRQDGEKLELKVSDAPTKDADWFKSADKKSIKRFFEDLNDWFVAEVEERIVPMVKGSEKPAAKKETKEDAPAKKEVAKKETPKEAAKPAGVTPLGMKKVLKAYIAENYPDQEMPALTGSKLVEWYELALAEEELPFEEDETEEGEIDEDDLEAQLDALK